ncbi:chemotaxis protein CheB [Sphingomonas gei]|uniref:protein-glutamate methylesterase n=1 Tax=Sphingomonas gei TaxID=1395960 RepID=A0A4S1XIP5_9SPHN|nr:chemotaxis protein CheB [Sphingomonas gei]TGX54976.1 chemotaxis protein CheB [Sphingomonas gei]
MRYRREPDRCPALARQGGTGDAGECCPLVKQEPSVILIGASAGGVEALRTLVGALPADLSAALFIVLHIGSHKSELPWLLGSLDGLPASHAIDGELFEPGHIYIAPPDHHMVIEPGRISLTKGPRENWARPAIDPLFRSAASVYGANTIGVILTGALNDGTAGLYEVAQAGGVTIVQDPVEAVNPSMPRSALAYVAVDHCLPLAGIAEMLTRLVRARTTDAPQAVFEIPQEQPQEDAMAAEFTQNIPVAVTCPDCGGALRRKELGTLTQFACHIGHIYTAEVMLAAQFLTLERSIETAMRSLDERAELCRQMAEKARPDDLDHVETSWGAAMRQAHERAEPLRDILTREWIHPDGIGVISDTSS